jgi:oxalate---CoA ligase
VAARFALSKVIGGGRAMLRLIADRADRNPAAVALLAPRRPSLTSTRLCAEVGEQAQIHPAIDLGKEHRVALLLPNGAEGALGSLVTPAVFLCAALNPMCTANELDTALSHLKPKLLIMSAMTATPAIEREAGVRAL